MTQQQPLWPRQCVQHKPVVSVQRDGTVIRFCCKCGLRL